jgi:hypothetical protein
MAEQLVGAVDQVDLHRSERYHFAALVFSAEQPRAKRRPKDSNRVKRTGANQNWGQVVPALFDTLR